MDIIAISETSEKEDLAFLSNVEIEGYDDFHTACKSSRGTAIYVMECFNCVK